MPKPEIEEFARLLITHVRDEAISTCDRRLTPSANSVTAQRWRKSLSERSCEDFVREIIPDCVDETLSYLLHAIDDGLLSLSFTSSTGKRVDLTVDGESELAGWLASNAWLPAYSQERFNDDFEDLRGYTGPEDDEDDEYE